ncbi:MAG: biotin--[acetyl-CoA-carboxylase] ligase [Gemmatimonadaceae bacterium]|nr:biotin--[acetyl-CoA-carboxylase] ligase [Gemmatimonadaceae bacterium]
MTWDGLGPSEAAAIAGAPQAWVLDVVGSTMDEAHRVADGGAPSGSVVIAGEQTAGRGRLGKRWAAPQRSGLWMTSIHRDVDPAALDCLTIRVGLALARSLDAFACEPVGLKWPNDLLVGGRKVCGILTEARWRGAALLWVAVGVGVNLTAPADQPRAAGLRPGVTRRELIAVLPGMIRAAAALHGQLSRAELAEFGARDAVRDAALAQPARGIAQGIDASGALVVQTAAGREICRQGSLIMAQEDA